MSAPPDDARARDAEFIRRVPVGERADEGIRDGDRMNGEAGAR